MQRDRLPSPAFVLIVLWPHLIIDTITHLLPASFGVCELAFVTVRSLPLPLSSRRERVAFKKCSVLSGGPWPTSCLQHGLAWPGNAQGRNKVRPQSHVATRNHEKCSTHDIRCSAYLLARESGLNGLERRLESKFPTRPAPAITCSDLEVRLQTLSVIISASHSPKIGPIAK